MATNVMTPYSSGREYWGALPQWLTEEDAQRIASYQLYEEMYWSQSDVGINSDGTLPINMTTAKIIVEAIHRFLAVGWTFKITGNDVNDACKVAFTKLFKREELKSKVSSQKRFGLIRGDAILHIVGDPNKPAGKRLSIYEVDPASYFPIYDLENPDVLLGCYLIDQMTDASGRELVRRQAYYKEMDDNDVPTGRITSELIVFEKAGWDDRFGAKPETIKQVKVLQPETPLPDEITALPVYHWRNMRNTGDYFGSSAIRGIERILKAIDQTITDQDLSIALASLGVYVTDSPQPEEGWILGPGRVVQTSAERYFKRVNGITSITPSLEHAEYLEGKAKAGAGVPAIAAGDVDVQSAESGIALALKLMPLFAANAERELEMVGVLDHLLFDIQTMWFPAYEGLTFSECVVESHVDNPMPVNRAAVIDEVVELITNGLITVMMAIERLRDLGWQYSEADITQLVADAQAAKDAAVDPFGDRAARESSQGEVTDDADEGAGE